MLCPDVGVRDMYGYSIASVYAFTRDSWRETFSARDSEGNPLKEPELVQEDVVRAYKDICDYIKNQEQKEEKKKDEGAR